DHGISRKAIAQGRPGVLRCPVCSCAPCFVQTAHETAGAARTRSSLRPLFEEGGKFLAKLGHSGPRDRGFTSSTLYPENVLEAQIGPHQEIYMMILFGIINYTYTWYDPKGGPQEFADIAVELFLHGLCPEFRAIQILKRRR
ncbi:hypothetical protein JQ609_34110, partial [Bradyrhizobium sp. AUGA SZCCT0169]|nr:hypothetical protein [Bradyrhizobium sp. AUGA SZCCT0169]